MYVFMDEAAHHHTYMQRQEYRYTSILQRRECREIPPGSELLIYHASTCLIVGQAQEVTVHRDDIVLESIDPVFDPSNQMFALMIRFLHATQRVDKVRRAAGMGCGKVGGSAVLLGGLQGRGAGVCGVGGGEVGKGIVACRGRGQVVSAGVDGRGGKGGGAVMWLVGQAAVLRVAFLCTDEVAVQYTHAKERGKVGG